MQDTTTRPRLWRRPWFIALAVPTALVGMFATAVLVAFWDDWAFIPRSGVRPSDEPGLEAALDDAREGGHHVALQELTPWAWDRLHVFLAGSGLTSRAISDSVGDDVDLGVFSADEFASVFVFMKDDEVVRVLYDPDDPVLEPRETGVFTTDDALVSPMHDPPQVLREWR